MDSKLTQGNLAMAEEYQVWGMPLEKKRITFFGSFTMERWQWAEKLAAFLQDKGHEGVEIFVEEIEEDEEDDDDDDEDDEQE